MNPPTSLAAWLHDRVRADALLNAWRHHPSAPLRRFESNTLAIAALAGRNGRPLTVALPGGRPRLPLLAAVHAAAVRIPAFPSPFSMHGQGAVALFTRQIIRREELTRLDAAGVHVSPAIGAVRLRADGLVVPLPSGAPRHQAPTDLLLLVHPLAGSSTPTMPISTTIVDGVGEPQEFVEKALAWAEQQRSTAVLFADIARRTWKPETLVYPCGWAAIAAEPQIEDTDGLSSFAATRGHAAALAAGPQPALATAGAILADARRLGAFPAHLVDAAIAWRRLTELVVPLATYDAACRRWHGQTMSTRLRDIDARRTADFLGPWRTWAETSWAALTGSLLGAADTLSRNNPKENLLVELVDAELRSQNPIDIATPSRIARDAIIRHLAAAGVPAVFTGLCVRSLGDAEAWGPSRRTLFTAPPARTLRHRLTGADIGALNVLCYEHETRILHAALTAALDEPALEQDVVSAVIPPALNVRNDLLTQRPDIVVAVMAPSAPAQSDSTPGLRGLLDAVDMAGRQALTGKADAVAEAYDMVESDDLDDAVYCRPGSPSSGDVTLTVVGVDADHEPPSFIRVPAETTLTRLLNGRTLRIPVTEVQVGMLLLGHDGQTLFERLRPLLVQTRGAIPTMLLAAWDHALEMALAKTLGPTELARALRATGASITANAVAAWSRDERIGPSDAENVRRVGEIAAHPIVATSAAGIADIMRTLRALHRGVGRAVAAAHDASGRRMSELEDLLGPDALSIVNELVSWRVLAVELTASSNSMAAS
jgi:hypothetical protein